MSVEDSRESIGSVDPDFVEAADLLSASFDAFTRVAQEGITAELARMVAASLRMAAESFDGLASKLAERERSQ